MFLRKSKKKPTSPGRKVNLRLRFQWIGLKNIILSSKSKSFSLDPLRTWLLKNWIDVLLPTLTTIFDRSLDQGIFLSECKRSLVRPIQTGDFLDQNSLEILYHRLIFQFQQMINELWDIFFHPNNLAIYQQYRSNLRKVNFLQ